MSGNTADLPMKIKHVWVYRYWQPRSDPLHISIRDNQALGNALRSRGELVPQTFFAITGDGTQEHSDQLYGEDVREDTIIRTALMEAVPEGDWSLPHKADIKFEVGETARQPIPGINVNYE